MWGACDRFSDTDSGDVEALRPKAIEITELLIDNDWAAIREHFDDTMKKGLSEDGLATAWTSVTTTHGPYVSHGKPVQNPKAGRYIVFDTPLTFERGEMKERVAFHPNGKIAGFFILNPTVP